MPRESLRVSIGEKMTHNKYIPESDAGEAINFTAISGSMMKREISKT
jgi:hypothetical protein